MTSQTRSGTQGEQVAANYLLSKGYQIIERNYRYKRSEVDLVVRKNACLVFVEVKTRTTSRYGFPETFVSNRKRETISTGARRYVEEANWEGNMRFDVVAVMMKKGLVKEVAHFEDAFY